MESKEYLLHPNESSKVSNSSQQSRVSLKSSLSSCANLQSHLPGEALLNIMRFLTPNLPLGTMDQIVFQLTK
jgi:hypothetical protein